MTETDWEPIDTFPPNETHPIAVWEGEWRHPRQHRVMRIGSRRGTDRVSVHGVNYRTVEGEAYEVTHWLPTKEMPR